MFESAAVEVTQPDAAWAEPAPILRPRRSRRVRDARASRSGPTAEQRQAAIARLGVLSDAPTLIHTARVVRLRVPDPPRVELARIATTPPSPQTLAALHAIDIALLSAHDRVTWLMVWERHRGWFDAHAQRGIVAVGGAAPPAAVGSQPDSDRDDIGREQVALALRLSSVTGGGRLDVARELSSRTRRTLEALGRGELTYWHAKAVADAVGPLTDAAALAVESAALDNAPPFETLTQFRARVARAVIAADPQTADEQHLTAVAGRRVVMWPDTHGMATVQAILTADEAMAAMSALTAHARRCRADGDDRPVDVLRADAFTRVFDAALADPSLPEEQRSRPRIGMTIDFATLVGLAEHPGHLDGYGPIPPVMARRIAGGGDWHRMVTDPVSGALLDYGTKSYRPPAELVEFLTARDRTCRMPTCARPARLCDLDHAESFDSTGGGQGGSTSAAGVGCLCRRNHRQKTAGDILLVSHPDGSATWTTTAGHTYHRAAVDHCPEHTAHLRELREQAAAIRAEHDAHTEAAAADLDGQHADNRWDDPSWQPDGSSTDDPEWPSDVGIHGPPADDDVNDLEDGVAQTAADAHDATADEASVDDPHTDTTSGNDPPDQ